ncbi:hypothetical protein CDCA_CDCA11G3151 [Cyanidium caldarium]|uniref:Uncharacterized protein n=1 Tax=Cyanidium caldarium TaxID=2771 RepID=A0AAV9IYA7_CYACA|nr:hypothetical protein CDCA_CDCA11G3151 [Cyanidium caldarium]
MYLFHVQVLRGVVMPVLYEAPGDGESENRPRAPQLAWGVEGRQGLEEALETLRPYVHRKLRVCASAECSAINGKVGAGGLPRIEWQSDPEDKCLEVLPSVRPGSALVFAVRVQIVKAFGEPYRLLTLPLSDANSEGGSATSTTSSSPLQVLPFRLVCIASRRSAPTPAPGPLDRLKKPRDQPT